MTDALAAPASTDHTELFWALLEKNMGCFVPSYLKNILRVRGYDNPASIGSLNQTDIENVQEYFRKKLKSEADRQNVANQKFFHEYHQDLDQFEILPGHLKLLEKIILFINSMIDLHGHGYFDPRADKKVRKPESRAMVRAGRFRSMRKIPETIVHSEVVIAETQSQPKTLLQPALLSEESLIVPSDEGIPPDIVVQSDGSLEKFISDERAHLIGNIRTWMKKNALSFFEQYADRLVPEILEAVMENSKAEDRSDENSIGENADNSDLMVLVFIFCCPLCGKKIRASQQQNQNGEAYFSLSNVERHWKLHTQENEPKKPKTVKDKKAVSTKPQTRKQRCKKSAFDSSKDDVEYEVMTDEEADGTEGDFKIVSKRKVPMRK